MSLSSAKPIHEFRRKRYWVRWLLLGGITTILVITASVLIWLWIGASKPLASDATAQTIVIEEGSGTRDIGALLQEQKIIASSRIFSFATLVSGARGDLQAGAYELSAANSPLEIVDLLRAGNTKEVIVTIPEGLRLDEIALLLDETDLISDSEFLDAAEDPGQYDFVFLKNVPSDATLEGFLFPDTYHFAHDATATDVINKMLDNFERQIEPLLSEIDASDFDLFELVTLASLIEGEVSAATERPLVAGVFVNRLDLGMPLQSDATLVYITKEDRTDFTFDDIEIDDPYNTYKNAGLPPGPINAPGLESLQAALNPAETDFIYFVSNPDTGETRFSETLDEHNINVEELLGT